ncbi:class I SAM-dependent RNA methyltransferase [Falsarthrobacter nasiphocae]|uniref:tRNA/tmRNA/rRNA uracil-C5-methylase (TrmA/RlmC/RlmD family) n=1 Tax=Falsarthrobacter nasiphocae TaxID=189863 RepID=A0AAE4C5N5_9MICC|nr:TRAM domain-containing protein [Falsarthrobacter nasiphocae]MDR6891262.1 tRNA/tmRNA/rRNA uracil-C5-methylase (TrmA/RlmC/RlmD family) [Falsarthrobacter nasiphocae]
MSLSPHRDAADDALPRVGDAVEVRVGRPANGGANVARLGASGAVVFVEGAVEGELVVARITRAKAGESFLKAVCERVLEPSPDRRAHPWPAADPSSGRVGGAELGHVEPAEQRRVKAVAANEALVRIGRFEEDDLREAGLLPDTAEAVPVPSGSEGGRTRVAFAVGRDGRLGMHPKGSRDVVGVEDMPLAVDLLRIPALFALNFSPLERVELATDGSRVLVLLVPEAARRAVRGPRGGRGRGQAPRAPRPVSDSRLREIAEAVAECARSSRSARAGDDVAVAAWWPTRSRLVPLIGEPVLWQEVRLEAGAARRYRVTGDGFWQIHEGADAVLAQAAVDLLAPRPGERLADLYAGAGLFTGSLLDAARAAGGDPATLLSVEASPGTSADAAATFADEACVDVRQSVVERALDGVRLDAAVLDPSRSGAGAEAIDAIARTGAERLVYVSCDAGSFARDARLLAEHGYRMTRRGLWDIYPDTHHVETLARFERPRER